MAPFITFNYSLPSFQLVVWHQEMRTGVLRKQFSIQPEKSLMVMGMTSPIFKSQICVAFLKYNLSRFI